MMRPLVLSIALAVALPGAAAAEGARLTLECQFVTACSEAGDCDTGDGPARFTVAPEETDAGGAGRYGVSVDDGAPQSATAPSRTGPFTWAPSPDTRKTLVLTGETTALWIRQVLVSGTDHPPSAEIDFLTCEGLR